MLRMPDRSVSKLGEQPEFQIESMTARQPRFAEPSELSATVGIGGTDFWSVPDAAHDAVRMFEGEVEVVRDNKPGVMLDKPGALWVVFTGETKEPAGQATPEQLAKFIGHAEMQPDQGIVLRGGRWCTVADLMPSGSQANTLRTRLQTAGYPAEVMTKDGRF